MGTGTLINQREKRSSPKVTVKSTGISDMPLFITIIILAVFGLVMVFSASWDYSIVVLEEAPTYMFNRQVLWMGLGIVILLGLSNFDYHHLRRLAVPVMLFTVASLVGVLFINDERLGAVRAYYEGSIQPSELAKLVIVVYLSVWLYAKREHLHDVNLGLIPLGIILGVVGGLIFLQPDLSAAGTILFMGGLLFFLAGGDSKQIVFLLVMAVIAGTVIILFSPTGLQRVLEFWYGIINPEEASYHVQRSLEAIYKGGFFGVGLGQATTKFTGLPVAPTDSIFAVITEELGLIGALFTISLYAILLWRGLDIARNAPDALGAILASGLTFWITLEATINICVMIGLLPFAGNALPFISAGGSSLTVSLAAIGILFNIARQSNQGKTNNEGWSTYGATVDLRRGNRRRRLSGTRRS